MEGDRGWLERSVEEDRLRADRSRGGRRRARDSPSLSTADADDRPAGQPAGGSCPGRRRNPLEDFATIGPRWKRVESERREIPRGTRDRHGALQVYGPGRVPDRASFPNLAHDLFESWMCAVVFPEWKPAGPEHEGIALGHGAFCPANRRLLQSRAAGRHRD